MDRLAAGSVPDLGPLADGEVGPKTSENRFTLHAGPNLFVAALFEVRQQILKNAAASDPDKKNPETTA